MGSFTSPLFWQIQYLVNNSLASKKTFSSAVAELNQLVELYGDDARLFLLTSLMESIDFRDQKSQAQTNKLQLLSHEIIHLAKKPNFPSVICQVLEAASIEKFSRSSHNRGGRVRVTEEFLVQLCRALKLTLPQQLLLALGISQSSNSAVSQEGAKFLKSKLPQLQERGGKLPQSVLHTLVDVLRTNSVFTGARRQMVQCLRAVVAAHPEAAVTLELAPLLAQDPTACTDRRPRDDAGVPLLPDFAISDLLLGCNLDDIVKDVGYSCTESVGAFREILEIGAQQTLGPVSGSPRGQISELDISRVLLMMSSTLSGLDDALARPLLYNLSATLGNGTAAANIDGKAAVTAAGGADSGGTHESKAGESKGATTWNLEVVSRVLREDFGHLDWIAIFTMMDEPGDYSIDMDGFKFLSNLTAIITGNPLQGKVFCGRWTNTRRQFHFIRHCLEVPSSYVDFRGGPEMVMPLVGLTAPCGLPCGAIVCLELVRTFLWLAETDLAQEVRELLNLPIRECPEVLTVALASCHSTQSELKDELLALLLPRYLGPTPHTHSSLVVHRVWEVSPQTLIRGACQAYRKDRAVLPRLLDIAQELRESNALDAMLQDGDLPFVVDLATLAASRELLNLPKFLKDRLEADMDAFARVVLACIRRSLKNEAAAASAAQSGRPSPAGAFLLNFETLSLFFKALQASQSVLSAPVQVELKALYDDTCKSHPQLFELNPNDIEEMANSYFQKIYTSQQSIPEVIDMLKRFKNSSDKHEQEIYSCMIHNLFDEYRFFHKYPDKELRITGVLFGALIQHKLVNNITLGIALRYVLEALRKAPTTTSARKMVKFGLYALDQFKSRLSEWPQYCSHVVQIVHLRTTHPALVTEVERAMSAATGLAQGGNQPSQNPTMTMPPTPPTTPLKVGLPEGAPSVPPAPLVPPEPLSAHPPFAAAQTPVPPAVDPAVAVAKIMSAAGATPGTPVLNSLIGIAGESKAAPPPLPPQPPPAAPGPPMSRSALAIQALLQGEAPEITDPEEPSEELKDRMHFIINNVAMQNMDAKVRDARALLQPQHLAWLGYSLVVKRFSLQPNYHALYLVFVEKLAMQQLEAAILECTLLNIRKLLASPKIRTSTSERSLLKNLGLWLGKFTLGRNKPVLFRDLDLKELLYQAYERGVLIAVAPFVAKVLEAASSSKVFKAPNPWVMALMRTLRELYDLPDLKLNLKFEVEVLCKKLGITLDSLRPNKLLAGRQPPNMYGNPDFNVRTQAFMPLAAQTQGQKAAGVAAASGGAPTETAEGKPQPPAPTAAQPAAPAAPTGETVIPNLSSYINISNTLVLFQQAPALKRVVAVSVDRAIREIIQPVVERSVTIACITARELVVKDFAMEPDASKMRAGAHRMVSNLAGSLALVTCKEPLRVSIGNHLRNLLASATNDTAQIDAVVTVCSAENLELGCMLIEKAATEKAVHDIDEALAQAYALRANRQSDKQPYYDMSIFSGRYPAALPEPLRPKPGGLQPHQLRVYDQFTRAARVPQQAGTEGAAAQQPPVPPASPAAARTDGPSESTRAAAAAAQASGKPTLTGAQALEMYNAGMVRLDQAVQALSHAAAGREVPLSALGANHGIIVLLRELQVAGRLTLPEARSEAGLTFAQQVFKRLSENPHDTLRLEVYLAVLEAVREVCGQLDRKVMVWLAQAPSDVKLNRDLAVGLLRSRLLRLPDFDVYLSSMVDNGKFAHTVEFAMHIVRRCCVSEAVVKPTDLRSTLEGLLQLSQRAGETQVPGLSKLLDAVRALPQRAAAGGGSDATSGENKAPEPPAAASNDVPPAPTDPEGSREQIMFLLERWVRFCNEYGSNSSAQSTHNEKTFLVGLQHQGMLNGDANTERLIRVTTEVCVQSTRASTGASAATADGGNGGKLKFHAIDALTRLFVLMVKHADAVSGTNNTAARIDMLNIILAVVAFVLLRDAAPSKATDAPLGNAPFDQRPYLRLFVSLLTDLQAAESGMDAQQFALLSSFVNLLHMLQPVRAPGFAFAWLELVSHRMVMPKLLLVPSQKGWPAMQTLISDLFRFMEPFLRTAQLNPAIRLLYKGTLRVLLVLLHDFPEFLCDYHFSFCDYIPPSCIQLRNLILSAFPRNMRLPDPFTRNLKVDLLPEIKQPPRILSNVTHALAAAGLKDELDAYVRARSPAFFLQSLPQRLMLSPAQAAAAGSSFNVPLINSLVLYLGSQAIAQLQSTGGSIGSSPLAHTPYMDVFETLANKLSSQGRYLFFNAMVNQLRYPNNHTHYFSCVLLYIFSEASQELVQEQITRVLLERLIVHRPHPWGLLITFIELIKNPQYKFWSHEFTHCAAEIKRLFESVARSCMNGGGQASSAKGPGSLLAEHDAPVEG